MKEIKIIVPDDYDMVQPIDKTDNYINIILQKRETRLPKSWEEFCKMNKIKEGECYIGNASNMITYTRTGERSMTSDRNNLPDHATAKAVLALCQIIQLRNVYNGDWIPNWKINTNKYCIVYKENEITTPTYWRIPTLLYFKTEELRDEFLKYFRNLIEKLKPLYGIREGGEG